MSTHTGGEVGGVQPKVYPHGTKDHKMNQDVSFFYLVDRCEK